MNNTTLKLRVVIGVLIGVLIILIYGYIPVKVVALPWNQNTLLSRPEMDYTSTSLDNADLLTRSQLLIEKARANYYGAIYNKQYEHAYTLLPERLQKQISLHNFEKSFGLLSNIYKSHLNSVVLENINSIRILREYSVICDNQKCKATVVGIFINSNVEGKTGPVQTLTMLDIWGSDGKTAYVIPGNFAQWSASYDLARE